MAGAQQDGNVTTTSASASASASASTSTNDDNNHDDDSKRHGQAILLYVAQSFRQHAKLYCQQADQLERIACHINEPSKWTTTSDPSSDGQKEREGTTVPQLSLESLEERMKREMVVDLAKKTYESTMEMQKYFDSFTQTNVDDDDEYDDDWEEEQTNITTTSTNDNDDSNHDDNDKNNEKERKKKNSK